jgi:hypothetical protein
MPPNLAKRRNAGKRKRSRDQGIKGSREEHQSRARQEADGGRDEGTNKRDQGIKGSREEHQSRARQEADGGKDEGTDKRDQGRRPSLPRRLLPLARCLLPVASCPLPLARCLLPDACCPLPVARCLLPVACCPLPVARCLLPIARCLLPVAYCLFSPQTKPKNRPGATKNHDSQRKRTQIEPKSNPTRAASAPLHAIGTAASPPKCVPGYGGYNRGSDDRS